MSEFANEVWERVGQARRSLAEAEATGDDYLAGVRVGELESLGRLAAEHGVDVPGLEEDLARHGEVDEIRLPDTATEDVAAR